MKFMTLGMGVLTASMIFTAVTPVAAASKQTVYLVDHYKGDESFFPNLTVSYTKSGLISTIKQKSASDGDVYYNTNYSKTFTYKNNRIGKIVYKSPYQTETETPVYTGTKLNKLKWVQKKDGVTTKGVVTYIYSGKNIVKSKSVYSQTGSKEKQVANNTYSYKNSLLTKSGDFSYKYDNKGYLAYKSPVYLGDESDGAYFKNTYNKQGLLTKTYIKKFDYYRGNPIKTPVLTVTYKKVKVSTSLVKRIKSQQKWILRNVQDDSIYNV